MASSLHASGIEDSPFTSGRRWLLRIPITILAIGFGLFSALAFQHKCGLGAKWFENSANWAFPLLFGMCSLLPRRSWVAVCVVASLVALTMYGLAPFYLAVVHPNGEG